MAAMSDDTAAAAASFSERHIYTPSVFSPTSPQVGASTQPTQGGGGSTGPSTGGSSSDAQALKFTATCQSGDAVGNAVRMDGAANAVRSVTNADPYPTVGIIVAKASATSCTVQTYGLASGAVSNLTPLQRYFVGPSGKLATAGDVFAAGQYVQLVGFAVTPSVLFIQPSGTIGQLATSSNAEGDNTTPPPSGDGQQLLYGGLLYGTTPPADDLGRKNDGYYQLLPSGGVVFWGPKPSDGAWSYAGTSLTDGRVFLRHGPPDDSIQPEPNDLWLDLDTDTLYPAGGGN